MSFDNKVIVITGASSGIGADVARHLSKLGGKIVLIGRNADRLNRVVEGIKSGGKQALGIVADVTKDAEKIIDETIKHFGRLDVLINNAGVVHRDSSIDFKLSEFDRIFNTNLRSVLVLTNLAVPHLEKTKGNIINVSSVAGLAAIPNVLSYCISKAALDQFTKCCALDLAPKGIRVNAINPAIIKTPIFERNGIDKSAAEEYFKLYSSKYPIGRVGECEDTSNAIAYLASDKASFLTGILMSVDGGAMVAGETF